jgi:hypothetical protein
MAPKVAARYVKSIRIKPEPAKMPIAVMQMEPGMMLPTMASDSLNEIKKMIINAK